MIETQPTMAQQIAEASIAFQRECTGRAPESVTVLLGEETLVVTLREALSSGEREMARTAEGAARVHEFHRQLFQSSAATLHQELKRILGVDVRDSTVQIEPVTGSFVEVLPTGDLVQVFRLAKPVATQTWSTARGEKPEAGSKFPALRLT